MQSVWIKFAWYMKINRDSLFKLYYIFTLVVSSFGNVANYKVEKLYFFFILAGYCLAITHQPN